MLQISIKVLLLAMFGMLISCSETEEKSVPPSLNDDIFQSISLKGDKYKSFQQTFQSYYDNLKEMNWEQAYKMHTNSFRETVRFARYKSLFDADKSLQKFVRYELISAKHMDDQLLLYLNIFVEDQYASGSEVKIPTHSKWFYEDNIWQCDFDGLYDRVHRPNAGF